MKKDRGSTIREGRKIHILCKTIKSIDIYFALGRDHHDDFFTPEKCMYIFLLLVLSFFSSISMLTWNFISISFLFLVKRKLLLFYNKIVFLFTFLHVTFFIKKKNNWRNFLPMFQQFSENKKSQKRKKAINRIYRLW